MREGKGEDRWNVLFQWILRLYRKPGFEEALGRFLDNFEHGEEQRKHETLIGLTPTHASDWGAVDGDTLWARGEYEDGEWISVAHLRVQAPSLEFIAPPRHDSRLLAVNAPRPDGQCDNVVFVRDDDAWVRVRVPGERAVGVEGNCVAFVTDTDGDFFRRFVVREYPSGNTVEDVLFHGELVAVRSHEADGQVHWLMVTSENVTPIMGYEHRPSRVARLRGAPTEQFLHAVWHAGLWWYAYSAHDRVYICRNSAPVADVRGNQAQLRSEGEHLLFAHRTEGEGEGWVVAAYNAQAAVVASSGHSCAHQLDLAHWPYLRHGNGDVVRAWIVDRVIGWTKVYELGPQAEVRAVHERFVACIAADNGTTTVRFLPRYEDEEPNRMEFPTHALQIDPLLVGVNDDGGWCGHAIVRLADDELRIGSGSTLQGYSYVRIQQLWVHEATRDLHYLAVSGDVVVRVSTPIGI